MTDRTQFEAMLEALINEDHESAKDIFHNIVVAKSREIYEHLLSEEFEEEENVDEAFGEEESDDEGESENPFGSDDEGDDEEEGEDPFASDEEGEDPFGGDEEGEGEGDLEDRVLDLEDALEELKSEFEQLLAGEEEEPEHDDMFGGDDMGGDEFGAEKPVDEFSQMFEYVNKVALPKHGDNGINNKSIFNKPKYNDMGGTVNKFGGTAQGEGTQGGLLNPSTKDLNSGNINVPGGKAGKTGFKKQVPNAHGAEKKGKGESGAETKSLISGR